MAQIVLDKIDKIYAGGVKAVDGLSLEIRDGEFMVLVGPSGCGKSTALRSIAGLEEISAGTIVIGDRVVNDLPPKERDIAMVFQNYALYPHMTVEQNLAFGLQLRKTPKNEIKRRVTEAARMLGLDQYLKRKPAALSGGQRQRVAMGRAIVREPQAFLMDEPLSNLDAKLRVSMRASLNQLHERLGVTTVYVTHDQVEAMTLGHRVCVLRDGMLQQVDTPTALFDSPVNLFVAGFIGSPAMNFVTAELVRDGGLAVTFAGHRLAVPEPVLAAKPDLEELHRPGGHPRHPALGLRGRRPGRRELAAHAGQLGGDGGAWQRDPRDLHDRRAAGGARQHHRGRPGRGGRGRGRGRAGGRQVAVDRAGRGPQLGAPGHPRRAGCGHLEPALLRPGQRPVHRPSGSGHRGQRTMTEPAEGAPSLMTEIDTSADLDIVWRQDEVAVNIPLAGEVPAGWARRYDELASRQGLTAQAQEHPSRAWIVVTMPAATEPSQMVAALDSARDLIGAADAVAEQPPDAEETAAVLRKWWARQKD